MQPDRRRRVVHLASVIPVLVAGAVRAACSSSPSSTTTTSSSAGATTPASPCAPVPASGCASPAQVAGFVSLATAGVKLHYVATYRYLGPPKGFPSTFVYDKAPGKTHLGDSFSYSATSGTRTFRALDTGTGFYECTAEGFGPWSCYGPNPGEGQGTFAEQFSYDVAPDYLSLFQPPPNGSVIATRTVAGQPSTCLTYTVQGPVSRTTWCVTSTGVLDYFDGLDLFHAIELTNLSMTPRSDLVTLPTRSHAWTTGLETQYPAFAAPGWAL